MPIQLKCRANCDDVFMVWSTGAAHFVPIANCVGFSIEVRNDATGAVEFLKNLKGFEADSPAEGESRPSDVWPFQTFTWTHHAVLVGAKVSYRVTAMVGAPGALRAGEQSDWEQVVLSPDAGPATDVYFNRGLILSQFVSRYAKAHGLTTTRALKSNLTSTVDGPLMQFLTGDLGAAIRGILKRAGADPRLEIYCALFELDLDDLIEGLLACGARAHVILANGSVKVVGEDENSGAAVRLVGKVDLHRRMTAPHGLAHNKFVVVCRDGKPTDVWTGSTNWTLTGLHTQINNGIAIESEELASAYLDHWHELAEAGNKFPHQMVLDDGKPRGPFDLQGGSKARVWFTPTSPTAGTKTGGADIEDLKALVAKAKEGILFVMFMPGAEPLDSILHRQIEGLYVRGVVSTLPMGTHDNPSATFQIMTGKDFKSYSLDVVQPQGATATGSFISTFTRQEFLSGMGFAITHSKVIVIDPFGDHPVVVAGSHNLSNSASTGNDENLLIIENCPELARAYAVNCMSVYKNYRWPAFQHDTKHTSGPAAPSGYLSTTDAWQAAANGHDLAEDVKFWR